MKPVVGARCVVERRSMSGRLDHRRETKITKVTPKRAYVGIDWFELDDPEREVKPRYLDYRSYVTELRAPEKEGTGT